MDRRQFFSFGAGGVLTGLGSLSALGSFAAAAAGMADIKAVAFDGFPIFDPRSILARANAAVSDHPGFGKAWFDKIFVYTWLRTLGDRYLDIFAIADQALAYTEAAHDVSLGRAERAKLIDAWMQLKV